MKYIYNVIFFIVLLNFSFLPSLAEQKKALIFGVTGQDGAYLSELLLEKGYIVHGVKRRSSSFNTSRIDHLYQTFHATGQFFLHYGDITDTCRIVSLIKQIQPHEIYNLAAQSHVRVSFDLPEYTAHVDAIGTLRILEAIRCLNLQNKVKFYQASTSELFGKVLEIPQTETTPFNPRSPYGVAKLYGFWITKHYREAYDIFACNGILFNHESPIRGETFVTKKITNAAVKIKLGLQKVLYLGNLNAYRDWGHARDYVYAMWLMLQQEMPDDFVIATGKKYSVREFVELAFKFVGINIAWRGSGINEVGYDSQTGRTVILIDSIYYRPTEVDLLIGDASKAKKILGWEPKINFVNLVKEMIEAELTELNSKLQKDLELRKKIMNNKQKKPLNVDYIK